jgi:hypothetical protein
VAKKQDWGLYIPKSLLIPYLRVGFTMLVSTSYLLKSMLLTGYGTISCYPRPLAKKAVI